MDAYRRTCLEEKMFNILSSLNVDFIEQLSVSSGFVLDFAVTTDAYKLAIETDGSNFHSSPKQRKRDRFRDMLLRKDGWTVIRFGETFDRDEVIKRLEPYNIIPVSEPGCGSVLC